MSLNPWSFYCRIGTISSWNRPPCRKASLVCGLPNDYRPIRGDDEEEEEEAPRQEARPKRPVEASASRGGPGHGTRYCSPLGTVGRSSWCQGSTPLMQACARMNAYLVSADTFFHSGERVATTITPRTHVGTWRPSW